MKLSFSLDKHLFVNFLSLVQSICGKRTAIDSTANILFKVDSENEIILRATDLEVSFQFAIPAKIHSHEITSFCVNAKRLHDFVRDLDGELLFEFDGSTLSINYGDGESWDKDFYLKLSTSDHMLFPIFPENIENIIDLDTVSLQTCIDKIYQLSNAQTSIIAGFLFDFDQEGFNIAVTNGHTLSLAKTSAYALTEPQSWVLSKKAVGELKKLVDFLNTPGAGFSNQIFLGTCKGQLVFSGNGFNFFSKLVNEPFPNYKPIIASLESFSKGRISLKSLLPSLKRVGYLLNGKFLPATFDFSNNKVKISFVNNDSGSFSEAISFDNLCNLNYSFKFFTPYLLSACSAFEEKDVEFLIKESNSSPIVLSFDNEGTTFVHLVMPVVS